LITTLRATLKGGWTLTRGFGAFLGLGLIGPIRYISRLLFRFVLVHLYRWYLVVKNRLSDFFSPARNKFVFVLTKKGVAHVIIILITVTVIIANTRISALRAETLGQNMIISDLVPADLDEEVIETIDQPAQKPISYLDEFSSVSPKSTATAIVDDAAQVAITETSGAVVKPTLTTTTSPNLVTRRVQYYIVEGGDTVSTIAEKFDISTNTLLWENRLGERDFIKPGQQLTILPSDGVSHQVGKGDTISSVAKKYGVSEDSILEYNQLVDASAIDVSQILLIPGGKPPAPPPTPVPTRLAGTQFASGPIPAGAPAVSGANLLWPTSGHKINQYFRYRHTGVDIEGDYSSPIWAAQNGTVEYVSYQTYGYGYHIIINHGGGLKTLYGHASKIFVTPGQQVSKGQTIAMVGTTGRSTGTHLHFEVIVSGSKTNPLSYY